MAGIDKLGADEGKRRGPKPGQGASSVGGAVAGGTDFEGTPGDVLPDRPGEGYAKDSERGNELAPDQGNNNPSSAS